MTVDAPGPGGTTGGGLDASSGALPPLPDAPRTGVPAVDAVLEGLAAVDDLPVAERAAALDAAHARLRQALDQASAPVPMPRPDLPRPDLSRPDPARGGRDG